MPSDRVGAKSAPDLSHLRPSSHVSARAPEHFTPGEEFQSTVVEVPSRANGSGRERGVLVGDRFVAVKLPPDVPTGSRVQLRVARDGETLLYVRRLDTAPSPLGETIAQVTTEVDRARAILTALKQIAGAPSRAPLISSELQRLIPEEVINSLETLLAARGVLTSRELSNSATLADRLRSLLTSRAESELTSPPLKSAVRPPSARELPSTSAREALPRALRAPLEAALLTIERLTKKENPTPHADTRRASLSRSPHTAAPLIDTSSGSIEDFGRTLTRPEKFQESLDAQAARLAQRNDRARLLLSATPPRSPLEAIERAITSARLLEERLTTNESPYHTFLNQLEGRLRTAASSPSPADALARALTWARNELQRTFGVTPSSTPATEIPTAVPAGAPLTHSQRAALKFLASQIELARSLPDARSWSATSPLDSPPAALLRLLEVSRALANELSPTTPHGSSSLAASLTRFTEELQLLVKGERVPSPGEFDAMLTGMLSTIHDELAASEDHTPAVVEEKRLSLPLLSLSSAAAVSAPPQSPPYLASSDAEFVVRAIEGALRALLSLSAPTASLSRGVASSPQLSAMRDLFSYLEQIVERFVPERADHLSELKLARDLALVPTRENFARILEIIGRLDLSGSVGGTPEGFAQEYLHLVRSLLQTFGDPASTPPPLPHGQAHGGAGDLATLRALLSLLIARTEETTGGEGLALNRWAHALMSDLHPPDSSADHPAPSSAKTLHEALTTGRSQFGAATPASRLHDLLEPPAMRALSHLPTAITSGRTSSEGGHTPLVTASIPATLHGDLFRVEIALFPPSSHLPGDNSEGMNEHDAREEGNVNRTPFERFEVWLALPALGEISCDIAHRPGELLLRMTSVDGEVVSFLQKRAEAFRSTLALLGFSKHRLTVERRASRATSLLTHAIATSDVRFIA